MLTTLPGIFLSNTLMKININFGFLLTFDQLKKIIKKGVLFSFLSYFYKKNYLFFDIFTFFAHLKTFTVELFTFFFAFYAPEDINK